MQQLRALYFQWRGSAKECMTLEDSGIRLTRGEMTVY